MPFRRGDRDSHNTALRHQELAAYAVSMRPLERQLNIIRSTFHRGREAMMLQETRSADEYLNAALKLLKSAHETGTELQVPPSARFAHRTLLQAMDMQIDGMRLMLLGLRTKNTPQSLSGLFKYEEAAKLYARASAELSDL